MLELLRGGDPPALAALRDALELLRLQAFRPDRIVELAVTRCRDNVGEPVRFATWWSALAARDASAAMDVLESTLAVAQDPDVLVEEACARAWEDRDGPRVVSTNALQNDGTALLRLAPIVYSHVRRADDTDHDGVYTPGRRDQAQDFRNSLFQWAAEAAGADAADAFRRLAEHDALRPLRSWLLHLADGCMTTGQRLLSEPEAVAFVDRFVRVPATTADLFGIAMGRLSEIADDIHNGDFSVRGAYCPAKKPIEEEHAQLLLADKLKDRRRSQYDVVREPEVTRRNKPDIRLLAPRCEGPVTIEVKIAERWSGHEMEDAITSQLVDKYMKANDSRYGVFVVCSSGPRKGWELSDGSSVSWDDLVEHLRSVAARVASQHRRVSRLEIVAIDFH